MLIIYNLGPDIFTQSFTYFHWETLALSQNYLKNSLKSKDSFRKLKNDSTMLGLCLLQKQGPVYEKSS